MFSDDSEGASSNMFTLILAPFWKPNSSIVRVIVWLRFFMDVGRLRGGFLEPC